MNRAIVSVLLVLLVVALSAGLTLGCGGIVRGSGKIETREIETGAFTAVDAGATFEVTVSRSGSFSVMVTADDNLFSYIEAAVEGETLRLGLKPALSYTNSTLRAEVAMPELHAISLSGASRGAVSGFASSSALSIEVSGASALDLRDTATGDIEGAVSGASRVTGDISGGNMSFDVSGASTVQLQGQGGDLTAGASGASRAEFAGLLVANAAMRLSGASKGTVHASGRLDARLSEASRLGYIGSPAMGEISTSGASTLNKIG